MQLSRSSSLVTNESFFGAPKEMLSGIALIFDAAKRPSNETQADPMAVKTSAGIPVIMLSSGHSRWLL
jgi:hypothetical protein